jgi:hypothetical protein
VVSIFAFANFGHKYLAMGWKCAADARGRILSGCDWKPTVVAASVSAHNMPTDACVVVDANAMLRSGTFSRLSANDVAKNLINKCLSSNPALVQIMFDSDDSVAYPPQRAQVHAERYPEPLPAETLAPLIAQFGVGSVADLAGASADDLPLRTRRDMDWQTCFKCPPVKAFVWRLLTNALRHAALEKLATDALGCTIQICAPDGGTVVVGTSDVAAPPRRHGEADLQVFAAAREHARAGKKVIIYSIDTDFCLMAMADCTFVPTTTFIIHLKTCVYDGIKLIAKVGGTNKMVRMNTTFWLLAMGCDYAEPLTKQGYYSKGIIELADKTHPGDPVITIAEGMVTVSAARANKLLLTLKRRAEPAKGAKKQRTRPPQSTALGELLFCLRYYGFMFPATGTPFPELSETYFDTTTKTWQFAEPV